MSTDAHVAGGRALRRWVQPGDSLLLLGCQSAVLLALTGLVVTKYWQDHPWIGFAMLAVAGALAAPEFTRVRARRWWFIYVAGIFAYTLLRSLADETAIPTRTGYVIEFDRWLGGGTDPIAWLQERFFDIDRVTALDWLAVLTHWSFFIAPHAAAVAVFLFRREQFPRYTALVVGTMWMGLVLFFLLPTTPPWLAGQEGALPGVYRVMDFVGGSVDRDTYESFYASLGEPNSVAAMPSIHMGVTFAMFLWAWSHARRLALPLLLYSLVMGAALVYLAEHYVLDLVAGTVCAIGCFAAANRWMPRSQAANRS